MKKQLTLPALLFVCLGLAVNLQAQEALSAEFKTAAIDQLSQLMNEHYVFPEVAQKTSEALQKQLKDGAFDQHTKLDAFADALTTAVQAVNHDKHMRIRPAPKMETKANTPERMVEERLNLLARQRAHMSGFREAKRLEGNIGYLDLRAFARSREGIPVADRYMGLLAGADAIIIDLRKNGGGDPEMVQYLCSYFFGEKTHLNSLYWREGDKTADFYTLEEVAGTKMPDVPVFILTSAFTFSAAEEFCYNLQSRKRATLVGETTGGGANPGGMFPINAELGVFIPTGRAINPVTKTNWEGTGVVPEVKTSAEDALDKAIELASKAAAEYREQVAKQNKKLMTALVDQLEKPRADDALFQKLQSCLQAGLFTELDINALGYQYLMQNQKPDAAEAIFKCNTQLFPQSANVYDSYAETLLANGKKDEAKKNYQKAIEIGEMTKDPNLELFRENLKAVDKKEVKRP